MAAVKLTPEFIAELYDAATDDKAFAGLASKVAAAVGVDDGMIMLMQNNHILEMSVSAGIAETAAPYHLYYKELDPWHARAPRIASGAVLLASELYPERELLRSEFYADFAQPIGMLRPLMGYATVGPTGAIGMGFEQKYTRRLADEEDKPALARLIPYLQKIAALRMKLRASFEAEARGHAALDALNFATVICNGVGRVLFANSAAEELARRSMQFRLGRRGEGLSAAAPKENAMLAKLIHAAANGGAGGAVTLGASHGEDMLVALVTPLPAKLGGIAPGQVLIALNQLNGAPSFSERMLSALFGLTPTQAAIALALFNGKTPEAIALERGIRITTLRTHLAEIFVKTGTGSQRELVRLLGALPQVKGLGPEDGASA